jgi:hypothetical protein
VRAEHDQREGDASPDGAQQATPAKRSFQPEQHQRQPGQADDDVMPLGQKVQQRVAREHVAEGRYQGASAAQPPAGGVGVHGPARHDHVGDGQPAQGGADCFAWQQVEQNVRRVEGRYFRVVDERGADEVIRAPQR